MTTEKGKRSAGLYVFNMFIIYALWKMFAYYVKHSNGFVQQAWGRIIYRLGTVYASVTSLILNLFGEKTTHDGIGVLFLLLNKKINIQDHCLAIPATIIFIGTILLFTGSWKSKLWFIPIGIFLIVLINITRLVFLCYTFAHFPRPYFDINHSLVYVVITYTLVFLMIVFWMRKFAYPNNER